MLKLPVVGADNDISKSQKAGAINDTDVSNVITEKYENSQQCSPYTMIGARLLISVNPNQDIEINSTENAKTYANEFRNTGKITKSLDPHIFKVVSSSFLYMKQTDINQSIIFLGESASGKTEQKKLALQMIPLLNSTKKTRTVCGKLLSAETVIEAFTNASVVHNNASRAFLYQELWFNEEMELVGCNFTNYCTEISRVTKSIKSEKNFHIMHYLANSANEYREELGIGIGGGATFEYLKKSEMETNFGFPDYTALFDELVSAMKVLGFGAKIRKSIFKVLTGILQLGNVYFKKDSGSYRNEVQAVGLDQVIKNLGVDQAAFKELLTTKYRLIGRQRVEVILSNEQALERRNEVSRVLYKQLLSWIIETINQNVSPEDTEKNAFMGLLDIPGFTEGKRADYYRLWFNFINERFRFFMMHQIFAVGNQDYAADGIKSVPVLMRNDRTDCMDIFIKPSSGVFAVMERQFQAIEVNGSKAGEFTSNKDGKEAASELVQVFSKGVASNSAFTSSTSKNEFNQFGVQHFWGSVTYNADSFVVENFESTSSDFTNVFMGDRYYRGSKNNFIAGLFSNPDESMTLDNGNYKNTGNSVSQSQGNSAKMLKQITNLVTKLDGTMPWFVLCINPNKRGRPNIADSKYIKDQVRFFNLGDVVRRKRVEFVTSIKHDDFCSRYEGIISDAYKGAPTGDKSKSKCEKLKSYLKLPESDFSIGKSKVFFSFSCWRMFEDTIRRADEFEDADISQDYEGDSSAIDEKEVEEKSTSMDYTDLDNPYYEKEESKSASTDEKEYDNTNLRDNSMSTSRSLWLKYVKLNTFLIPTFVISKCFGLKRKDMQIAWREKLTLCMFIFYSCLFVVFWIGILGLLICPKQYVYSIPELRGYSKAQQPKIAIRGEVFDMKDFNHQGVSFKYLADRNYFGKDLSNMFPLQLSYVCPGLGIDPRLSLQDKPILYSDTYYHDQRWYRHPDDDEAFNYYQFHLMRILRATRGSGNIAYDPKDLLKDALARDKAAQGRIAYRSIIRGEVFDLTSYVNSRGAPYVITPDGFSNDTSTVTRTDFLPTDIFIMFQSNPGKDVTKQWEKYEKIDLKRAKTIYQCLRGAFYIGKVDLRKSLRCYIANYMLLAGSIFIVSIIFFKFIASIRLGISKEPDTLDLFVVCNVPCYTEGEESLKSTIDSLARLKYDDKSKLIFIICDGMIMGSGNDRPTPRIVLDILGVDPDEDSEALSYFALGEGMKQHNMAKVYSGLYEVAGHVVPYIVIIKCGTPLERTRPGNRGKRDSQVLLMRFFNKVHFNTPMTPLELEIFHQIKNVIGVNPNYYEYVLMVDADTYLYPDSMNRLVSGMQNDARIMGVCGETRLGNSKSSWITMMQVYEYFIAHYLNKAFESLFGCVTCLPGCFCMYRIRSPEGVPLLIADSVVTDYSENNVDTLHKKNLLHLGEDRYLTTLMLKHFSNFKTKFVSDAKCDTQAPDSWRILLSQRRRWINSTVHNLFELSFLQNMCGFCCFSMRFVVFIDLISTIIMPATVAYLAILIYQVVAADSNTSYISLYLLAAIYGMQALVFIIHRQWQHIGWMLIYLFAIPLFSFVIPVYSFWHFDDFSWGNTRVVVGDSGKKILVNISDAEKFDPSSIPMRKWSDYEKDLIDEIGVNTQDDDIKSQFGGSQIRTGSAVGNIPRSLSRLLANNFDSQAETGLNYENGLNKSFIRAESRTSLKSDYDGLGFLRPNGNRSSKYDSTLRGSFLMDQYRSATPVSVVGYNTNNSMDPATLAAQQQRMQQHQSQLMRASYYQLNPSNPGINASNYTMNNQMLRNSQHMNPNQVGHYETVSGISPQVEQKNNEIPQVGMPATQMRKGIPNEFQGNQSKDWNSPNMEPQEAIPGVRTNWPSGIQDHTIYVAVSQILSQADLNIVTKKDIRNQVAAMLGISAQEAKERKEVINNIILEELNKIQN
ncbi:hypothetical protein BB560_000609 [Smittium megazygosporum]|uniref:chitin synthase n=1 Tax=Smittium megazygosporum TaxID=133381 RepID=A0A2T9ZK31_9FUNG|nr:hypothetical protein BB560_000609 [Smittium megazygosporum]